ncbi:Uncharacterised protein [Mycobacteroides abscessus subsp. massiliense]|nr:Uncharacterised protein [Mycobacteroides abscessus subsp. massiliense]
MLQRGRHGKVEPWRKAPCVEIHPAFGHPIHKRCRVTHLLQTVVEFAMFASMCDLLADEPGHLLLQDRVGDLVRIVFDRADEVVLTFGKHCRQHRDDMAHHQVTLHVVAIQRVRGIPEFDAPGLDGAGTVVDGGVHRGSSVGAVKGAGSKAVAGDCSGRWRQMFLATT